MGLLGYERINAMLMPREILVESTILDKMSFNT